MNVYEVIIKKQSKKLTKPYGSINSHYIKNDKVCFSVDLEIQTVKFIVESKSINAIEKSIKNIKSIKKIGEKYYTFEKLADDNYLKITSNEKIIDIVKKGQIDEICSDEVQIEYQKDKDCYLNRPKITMDWQ